MMINFTQLNYLCNALAIKIVWSKNKPTFYHFPYLYIDKLHHDFVCVGEDIVLFYFT